MGQGGRGNTSCSSTCKVSPLVRGNRVGEFISSRGSMASGHSRSSSGDSSASSSAGYIEHPVSRFDTLAGVAIKYGVEVGDVKRMNGLVTDLQMFALKTLKIPLPGRHPPTSSPNNPGFSGKRPLPRLGKPSNPALAQILKGSSATREPVKRPVTSAMGLLRGYYGLSTSARQGFEGTEMAVYKSDSEYHSDDEPFSPYMPFSPYNVQETSNVRHLNNGSSDSPVTAQGQVMDSYEHQLEGRRSTGKAKAAAPFEPFTKPIRSTALRLDNTGDSGSGSEIERANERLFRRRAKVEGAGASLDSTFEMPIAIAEVNDRNVPLGKSSALRQKIPPPFEEETDSLPWPVVNNPLNGWHTSSDGAGLAGTAVRALGTSLLGGKAVEGIISKIRRSASNPTLQEDRRSYSRDSSGTLMVSQGSIQSGAMSSVLEGFPKPGARLRNKAALD